MSSTLCVMATCNAKDILEDQIEAIRWSCEHPVEIVVVDDAGGLDLDCHVIRSKGKRHKAGVVGFKVNEGIAWAIEQGIDFDIVMVLDDDALIIGEELDSWAHDVMRDKSIGLLGVKDDEKACKNYTRVKKVKMMREKLKSWVDVPSDWRPPTENVFYAVNFQPRSLVQKLYDKGLLDADKEDWPLPCETFQAWVTELFGYRQEFWGQYPCNLIPPLYSMHHGSVSPENPRKIVPDFLVHHSIRNVKGVEEWEIRNHYKMVRGL